jgi:hypothetical protein
MLVEDSEPDHKKSQAVAAHSKDPPSEKISTSRLRWTTFLGHGGLHQLAAALKPILPSATVAVLPACPPLTLRAAAVLPYELLQHLLPQATDLAGAEGARGEGVAMKRRLGELHHALLARIARPDARAHQRHCPSRAPRVERCSCWRWRPLNRHRRSERRLPIWGGEEGGGPIGEREEVSRWVREMDAGKIF